MSIHIINTGVLNNPYYKLNYISPRLFDPVKPSICYPDLQCRSKNFSMCRFPNTKWNARLYYDSPGTRFLTCNKCRINQCDKYLYKI